ncbi:DUF2490 domain-containing protein [Arundinibacter roseus]|uniref:DUF2490 domain-containing protein n=1 Tax=Arundinibacter roseus TaxID=2070510 RepID=A0A4R4KH21_9BACT|nr:DUF2490 domain-containing protein [Arundinibacter roseus]TDB67354.1 DUF2490 domain-containing protein [Arundinibacter roseus]
MATRIFLCLFICFNSFQDIQAQDIHQSFYWIRYFNTLHFSPRLTWQNEADTRHFFSNNKQHQAIFHSRLAYKIRPKLQLAAGFTHSLQRPNDPQVSPRQAKPEFRGVQEFTYNTEFLHPTFELNGRIRTEQRFLGTKPIAEDQTYTFRFRHRYRLQFSYLLKPAKLALRVSDEILVNTTGTNLFGDLDQNRVYVCLEKRFSPVFATEIGYLHLKQPITDKPQSFQRDIVRLTFYHSVNLARDP